MCVFISLDDCDQVWLWNYNWFRVLHAVDDLNVKHELRLKKVKPFCIMQTIPNDISWLATSKIVFNFLHELKQKSSDVTGQH